MIIKWIDTFGFRKDDTIFKIDGENSVKIIKK